MSAGVDTPLVEGALPALRAFGVSSLDLFCAGLAYNSDDNRIAVTTFSSLLK